MAGAGEKFRVMLLTHGGAERVLERLAALEGVRVVGVFVETNVVRRRPFGERLRRSVRYDGFAATLMKLAGKLAGRGDGGGGPRSAEDARSSLRETAQRLGVSVHEVEDYHSEEARELMRAACADLGVIYGTNIVRESVFRIPRLGSINLHKGLAPFYRGGPPVFWELFNGEGEVGLTVHFVEAKVDAGDVLLQESVPLEYDYDAHGLDFDSFIKDYTARLSDRAARMVADAVSLVAAGTAERRAQDLSAGRRYRLPTKREKDELRRRLRARRREAARAVLTDGAGGR